MAGATCATLIAGATAKRNQPTTNSPAGGIVTGRKANKMLVTRKYPKVGDKVRGCRVVFDEEVLIEGVVTRVDRFKAGEETLTNVDIKTSEGYDSWLGWDKDSEIIDPVDDGTVENGWCNICDSYCWGDCEANGLKPTPKRITFEPYHKGDTGTVYEI